MHLPTPPGRTASGDSGVPVSPACSRRSGGDRAGPRGTRRRRLRVEVGFIGEPVFVGDTSGLEFHVTKGDQPISGLDKTLTAEVINGTAKRALPLTEREDDPGWYQSVFIPTVAGKYTFHLSGTIEGNPSTSRSRRARPASDEVQEAASGQFPVTLPTAPSCRPRPARGRTRPAR